MTTLSGRRGWMRAAAAGTLLLAAGCQTGSGGTPSTYGGGGGYGDPAPTHSGGGYGDPAPAATTAPATTAPAKTAPATTAPATTAPATTAPATTAPATTAPATTADEADEEAEELPRRTAADSGESGGGFGSGDPGGHDPSFEW